MIVLPVNSDKPKPPFWKGEILYRDYKTSLKIASFRRALDMHLKPETAVEWLLSQYDCDEATARNLA